MTRRSTREPRRATSLRSLLVGVAAAMIGVLGLTACTEGEPVDKTEAETQVRERVEQVADLYAGSREERQAQWVACGTAPLPESFRLVVAVSALSSSGREYSREQVFPALEAQGWNVEDGGGNTANLTLPDGSSGVIVTFGENGVGLVASSGCL